MKTRFSHSFMVCLHFLMGLFSLAQHLYSSPGHIEDSLLNIIHTSPIDSVKAIHYITLADQFTYNESKKAIEYAQKAIKISGKTGYHSGLAKGYERLGNAWFQLGDNQQASRAYLNAREANKKVGNYQIDASVYYNLGNIQHEKANFDSAIYYANLAGKVFLANNDSIGYGVSHYMMINEYQSKGFYSQAIEHALKALEIFRKHNVLDWEVYTLNSMAGVYNLQEKYRESLKLLETCLNHHRSSNNQKFVAITYRFMGDIYLTLEDFDRAATTLDSSYHLTSHYGFE